MSATLVPVSRLLCSRCWISNAIFVQEIQQRPQRGEGTGNSALRIRGAKI